MVFCGNNAYSSSLKQNGGKDVFGTHAECIRKGYARGYNQEVKDIPRFVQKWAGRYKAHIGQNLRYSDEPGAAWVSTRHVEPDNGKGIRTGEHSARKETEAGVKVCTRARQEADVADRSPLAESHRCLSLGLVFNVQVFL